jgi:NTE family protein
MPDARDNDLLRGLTPQELELLLPELRPRQFKAGQTILHRGEPGDCLYVIESGLVCVLLPQRGGADTILAQLGPGQIFGEMAILMGQPRSAEVRALADTVTSSLSVAAFFKVAGRSPTVLLNIGRVLAGRLSHMMRATSHQERRAVVVLLGAVPGLVGSLIATNLMAALALVSGRRALMLDVAPPQAAPLPGREWSPNLEEIPAGEELLMHLAALPAEPFKLHAVNLPPLGRQIETRAPGGEEAREAAESSSPDGPELVTRTLSRLVRVSEFVVVNLTGPYGVFAERVLPMANRAYLVAPDGSLDASDLPAMVQRWQVQLGRDATLGVIALAPHGASDRTIRDRVRERLALPECHVLPSQAELIREAARVAAPMALRAPQHAVSKAVTRLAREVAGLRVGLALGGGAARGVAHVGIIGALDRLGVPVDAVAGTSIGALVGAGVALGMNMGQIEETMDRLIDLWNGALRPTLPGASLLSARGYERLLHELAGDITIEELSTPYGAVAADLNTGRSVFIRRGSLAQAIRASASLPVVFPPVARGEYMLVDGAVTNPVPTQLARILGADVVLACELSGVEADLSPLEYPEPAPPQAGRQPRLPNILQTYLRCIDIMRTGRGEHDLLSADITFRPQLPPLSWKEFQKGGAPVEAGERAVEDQLDSLRELFPWIRTAP